MVEALNATVYAKAGSVAQEPSIQLCVCILIVCICVLTGGTTAEVMVAIDIYFTVPFHLWLLRGRAISS